MNRIQRLFKDKNKNLLSVFYTAGFPKLTDTALIAETLAKAGADIIEIGIPYSDPVADGPTIQESNTIALQNGMKLSMIIEQVKTIRKTVDIPIILMGYVNPVMQYGVEKFAKDAVEAGVDGMILPDLPMDEFVESYKELFDRLNLGNTFLISPTTSAERIKKIDDVTNGFIYAVSASSITGAKGEFSSDQLAYFERMKSMNLKNPFLIGFGISDQKSFSTASRYGSGAIVGSAFINLLKGSKNLEADITTFVKNLKGAA